MKTIMCVVMICTVAALGARAATGGTAKDELGEKNCYQSYSDPSRDVCPTSVISVVANPERFDGKNIEITGYLLRVNGVLTIFPSEDVYKYSAGKGGIELLAEPKNISLVLNKSSHSKQPITVSGSFTSKIHGKNHGSVGVISGDISAFAEKMPGVAPEIPD